VPGDNAWRRGWPIGRVLLTEGGDKTGRSKYKVQRSGLFARGRRCVRPVVAVSVRDVGTVMRGRLGWCITLCPFENCCSRDHSGMTTGEK
jgi:hypothetical protein